jgi:UDP-N-acetylglucosamine 4-epimerase
MIRDRLVAYDPRVRRAKPTYGPFRPGDVRHSKANISKAKLLLGYVPSHSVSCGLDETIEWYMHRSRIEPRRPLRVIRGSSQVSSLP